MIPGLRPVWQSGNVTTVPRESFLSHRVEGAMSRSMDPFFKELGHTVADRWKRANFSLDAFPGIALAVLEERPPSDHVDLPALMRQFLLEDDQPQQSQSGFGQPELIAFDHPKFYIQLLFWMEGTTDIHQHEFSGAFHVLFGSSIHALYTFENAQSITPHFRTGDIRMEQIELLETGRTVPIVSGRECIHSLFHLDMPSVTVVIRTQHDPGTGPQFNYLPPHVAFDPIYNDALTLRRKQLLDVLEQIEDPSYPELVREMVADLDLERGFFILQSCMGPLQQLDEWEETLAVYETKHGSAAAGVSATLEENVRREIIKELRGAIAEPELRFFLALLMNVPTRQDLLAMVGQRFPEEPPVETVLRWAGELGGISEECHSILDAEFPDLPGIPEKEQPGIFRAALRHFLEGGPKLSSSLTDLSAAELGEIRAAFEGSSLSVLVR